MGPFEIIFGGEMDAGIPALAWKVKEGFDTHGYTLYDLADRLRSRGWQVPAYSLPANAEDIVIQRILVRHGVSRDLAALLVDDIQRCLDYFRAHPVTSPLSEEEGGGYHH
jgi:glutamate decarboxylase